MHPRDIYIHIHLHLLRLTLRSVAWMLVAAFLTAVPTSPLPQGRAAGLVTAPTARLLTPEEAAWLKEHGPIRYAADPSFAPFESITADGHLEGITPEILELAAERLGTTIQPVRQTNWTQVLAGMRAGDADVLGTLTRTPERESFLLFSTPYLSVPNVLFVNAQGPSFKGFDDLRGKRLGVVRNYGAQAWLEQNHPEVELVLVPTTLEGMELLSMGRLEAMLENMPVGSYTISRASLINIRMLPEVLFTLPQHLGVRLGQERLLGILEKGLSSVSQQERLRIFRKWSGTMEHSLSPWIPRSVAALLAALLAAVLWNRSLSRSVMTHTRRFEASEARFRRLFDDLPIAAGWADSSGGIGFVNRRFREQLGYTLEDLPNLDTWFLKAYPDAGYRQLMRNRWFEAKELARAQGGVAWTMESHVARKDGTDVTVEITSREIDDLVVAMFQDVTLKRDAEDALRESQARLARAQRIAKLGHWELQLDGSGAKSSDHKLTWSDEVYRIFGFEPGQIQPSREVFRESVHPDDRLRVEQAVAGTLKHGTAYALEHRILLADGEERIVQEHAEVCLDPGAPHPLRLVGTVQDVTQLRSIEQQLRQAQKMEAVGRLAGGVAHDFNNLLTVIYGNASFVGDDPSLSPESRRNLSHLIEASRRATKLVSQLLAFARQQVMTPKPLDANTLLESLQRRLAKQLGGTVTLSYSLQPCLPPIEADPAMLEQIVMHLAANARDAMPQGGTLSIATSRRDVVELGIGPDSGAKPEGSFIAITIADTGAGIDKASLPRLFEPFFTTKEVGQGPGLGLAMVYGTVKQHGGFIEVQSEPGLGTTFTILLPVASPQRDDDAAAAPR